MASRLEDPVRGYGKVLQGIKIKGRSLFMVVLDIRSENPMMFMSERLIFI